MQRIAIALTIIAALAIGLATSPPDAPVVASPIVVGSPPGELARLTQEVATLRADLADASESAAVLQKELAAARAVPVAKSNCVSGACAVCSCPGDGRCAAGACKPATQPAAVGVRYVPQYQPRRRLFGGRR